MKSEVELFALREAEIKHARLAMLGSLGWPISEVEVNAYHTRLS